MEYKGQLDAQPPLISKGMAAPQLSFVPIRNTWFVFLAASARQFA